MKKVYLVVQVLNWATPDKPDVIVPQRQKPQDDDLEPWERRLMREGYQPRRPKDPEVWSFSDEKEASDFARSKAQSHPGSRFDVLVSEKSYLTAYPVTEVTKFGD